MRIPVIAFGLIPVAKRPVGFGVHVTEDTLRCREEIGPMARLTLTQVACAVRIVSAGYEMIERMYSATTARLAASLLCFCRWWVHRTIVLRRYGYCG